MIVPDSQRIFLIQLMILFAIGIVSCKQPPALNEVAHPVHMDAFMAKKLEKELLEFRKAKDEEFKTSPESPIPPVLRPAFTGLEYYPINWKYRFEGPVIRYVNPETFTMITTSGEKRQAIKYGYVRLYLDGKEFRLHVYRLLDLDQKNLLFIPFVDASVGKETYPAGRYIDLVEKPDGLYVIDFNSAYNPSCAYGGNYPCPVTPEENHLPVAIPAGEKNWPLGATIKSNIIHLK